MVVMFDACRRPPLGTDHQVLELHVSPTRASINRWGSSACRYRRATFRRRKRYPERRMRQKTGMSGATSGQWKPGCGKWIEASGLRHWARRPSAIPHDRGYRSPRRRCSKLVPSKPSARVAEGISLCNFIEFARLSACLKRVLRVANQQVNEPVSIPLLLPYAL